MTIDAKRTLGLPGWIGLAALLLYAVTVNPWVSLLNLGTVARACGWFWQPSVATPLTVALLWPFNLLPQGWVPFSLNLFTAVCAALVLALLARSVSLLAYDIAPPKPPTRERHLALLSGPVAWVPPVLSALLLSLQLSFWEHATSATGEMIDLLLFAYIVRCLLEFRIDQDQRWLSRSALLYGIGMVNNWAMIGYLPVYLGALLRLKGLGPFLDPRFLLRMAGWGLLGLTLYLFLPALHLFGSPDWGFWTLLKTHLKLEKDAISILRLRSFRALAVVSLLPLLVLSVRWKSHTLQFGDDTRVGVFLTKSLVHFVHAVFLVASFWVMLDPAFGPRNLHLGTPALTFYFGAALVFGYCAGHFLLLGSAGGPLWMPKAARLGIGCLLISIPVVLGAKNFPQIRQTNGPVLTRFAEQLYSDLPSGNLVVVSEEPVQLLLLRAEMARHRNRNILPVDATSLSSPAYHRAMASQFGARWPAAPTNNQALTAAHLLNTLQALNAREPVFYLHPVFGLFSEYFNDQPHGLVYQLTTNAAAAASESQANEELWRNRWPLIAKDFSPERESSNRSSRGRIPERNASKSFVGSQYSRALNHWGVRLQRQEHWPEAGIWFQRALALNAGNQAARINSEFNARKQQGHAARLPAAEAQAALKDAVASYANWQEALRVQGPVDEPSVGLRIGRLLLAAGHPRQAAREFVRAAELEPNWAAARLWLSQTLLELGQYERALEQVESAQSRAESAAPESLSQTLLCKATALTRLARTNEAEMFVQDFLIKNKGRDDLLAAASEFYDENKLYERELGLLEELLKRNPTQNALLVKKGETELNLQHYEAAIATLSKVLMAAPGNDQARLYRAIAYLRADQLDAARADYEQLLQKSAHSQNALFGLGAIAWRRQDTNAAIEFYQRYLQGGAPRSAQYQVAAERLASLRAKGAPPR